MEFLSTNEAEITDAMGLHKSNFMVRQEIFSFQVLGNISKMYLYIFLALVNFTH